MNKEQAAERINKLVKEIRDHNYSYYVLAKPLIDDFQFDMLMKELEQLEHEFPGLADPDSPTQKVGGEVTKEFPNYKHKQPMLSLSNVYNIDELRDFDSRVVKSIGSDFEYACELKFDGVAIALHYENGRLIKAVTRGDGVQGDVVTGNIRTIRSLPLVLRGDNFPRSFEIRGEVVMPLDEFSKLNLLRQERGEQPFANPRNATAGSIKMQESSEVAKRPLDCLFYWLTGDNLPFENHYENLVEARKWGFKVPESIVKCSNIEEVISFIESWEVKRSTLSFDTDGVVIKVNSLKLHEELGNTSKSPRWAIAYKYKAETAVTVLLSVDYQVGRTGSITPVANLMPVNLAGTVVKRASLHNEDIITKLDLHINDSVFVEKGGEIIPKITGVDRSLRPSDTEPVNFISHCPECKTTLVKNEDEAKHFCLNDSCPPRVKGAIEHFISRKAMDIQSLGEGKVELLYDRDVIRNVADLYDIKKDDILELEKEFYNAENGKTRIVRLKEKGVENILKGIENSKERPFEAVLFGLGIRHVGETVAKVLIRYFKNIDEIINASVETMTDIHEIGKAIANSVHDFFLSPSNIAIIERLKQAGLHFKVIENKDLSIENVLEDKIFVVSGTFENFSRDKLKESIDKYGGRNASSISGKTDFLVAGAKTGPSKRKKAEDLGVNIISEAEFIEMLTSKTEKED